MEGMSCGMCKGKVEKALQGMPGVTSASVDLEKNVEVL
ncbi:heavy-metal-associated domain-containing protein [Sporomusa ovata]|nr:heavy metal-associated domain-containing protein [Sporomusa ovata]